MAYEAMQAAFKDYIIQVKINTKSMCDALADLGCKVSGTENHLFLLNTLESFGLTGLEAQKKLEEIGITTNKNMLPNDKLTPAKTSGLRLGCAAITTRGATKAQCHLIAECIYHYLKGH